MGETELNTKINYAPKRNKELTQTIDIFMNPSVPDLFYTKQILEPLRRNLQLQDYSLY